MLTWCRIVSSSLRFSSWVILFFLDLSPGFLNPRSLNFTAVMAIGLPNSASSTLEFFATFL